MLAPQIIEKMSGWARLELVGSYWASREQPSACRWGNRASTPRGMGKEQESGCHGHRRPSEFEGHREGGALTSLGTVQAGGL